MPEPIDRDEIEGIVRSAIDDAVDFVETEISEDRIKAQRYFDGETDIGEEEGRSKVVATKVRDTVRAIKPSLMRIFLSSDKPVEYRPASQQDVPLAEQATKYAHYVFNESNGYRVLSDAIHDALVKKKGFIKVYWEEYVDSEIHTLSNMTDEEFILVVNDDDITVLEHTEEINAVIDPMGFEIQAAVHSMKIARDVTRGKLCIESIPPEEMFISRNSKNDDDYYVIGHETDMRVGDLVAMGFDYDEVLSLAGSGDDDSMAEQEDFERRGYTADDEENVADQSMRIVRVAEAYMEIDADGSGIPRLHKFTMAGSNRKMLDYELWDDHPFAGFEVDPEPHAYFGRSVADLLMEEQDATTAMLRGILDNVALVNNPQRIFNEDEVNSDDLMNNEIGALVRSTDINQVRDLVVPFVAGTTLPALQYMDEQVEVKSGVTKASMGLDPNALQNTTATAAQLTAQQGAGQIEVMARNLAEGGMRRMFKLMLKLFIENSDEEHMMQMNGQFTPVDPRSWNASMDVSVNVGLGTGKDEQKAAILQMTLQQQLAFYQTMGPMNGVVSLTMIRNTLADLLAIGGIRNADRYYAPLDPNTEMQILMRQIQAQQQMAAAQQQADPNAAYLQAEQMKAQAKVQTDMMKVQNQAVTDRQKLALEQQKMMLDDDRERDRMDQELHVKAAEIMGNHGTQVDVARVRAAQQAPRQYNGMPR